MVLCESHPYMSTEEAIRLQEEQEERRQDKARYESENESESEREARKAGRRVFLYFLLALSGVLIVALIVMVRARFKPFKWRKENTSGHVHKR